MAIYRQEWADEVREGVGDLSYSKAAARIGCSKSYISEWLTNKVPSRELVVAYARGLGRDLNRALVAAGYEPEDSREAIFSPAEHLFSGLIALEERFSVPVLRGFHLQQGFAGLTQDEAESVLQSLELLLTERLGKPNVG